MPDFGRKIITAAIAGSLCMLPTAAISAAPTVTAVNPWLALSAMTTSSSAVNAAAIAQGQKHESFPPIAPLAIMLSTIGLAIYIAVKNDDGTHVAVSPF